MPAKIVKKIEDSGIFKSFFEVKILLEVPKEKFYPIPRTNSLIVDLIKLPDPVEIKDLGRFLRQYIYQHEDQMIKNSLMEGLVKYQRLVYSKILTKNEARAIIKSKEIPKKFLDQHPNSSEIYELVEEKFNS